MYVCLCYVLVLFVSGGWDSSYSDTRSLFTQHIDIWWVIKSERIFAYPSYYLVKYHSKPY